MRNYKFLIERIVSQLPILEKENFTIASNGTNHLVFLSKNYVIRFKQENPQHLRREAQFLAQLNHKLIPKILNQGIIEDSFFVVEKRLPGQAINSVWQTLSKHNRENLVDEIIEFIGFQRTVTNKSIYSVKTGKKYTNFLLYLTEGFKEKITAIEKDGIAYEIINAIRSYIENPEQKNFFTKTTKCLVHGDLIIHNLLTDGKKITGVVDWEMTLFGDQDYDLFRLFYYYECAKSYATQENDETYEADFLENLLGRALKTNFIQNKKIFQRKYQFMRAIFFLNALHWALSSNDIQKNVDELVTLWEKNKAQHLIT